MAADSARCAWCKAIGARKGTDDYGHTHCARCAVNSLSKGRPISIPQAGAVWTVYCKEARQMVAVKSLNQFRDAPRPFEIPQGMFRRRCRMITVVVGKGDQAHTFLVEEPLLTTASPYFKTALKKTFKEGLTDRVELEDELAETFGMVNEYLHQGSIRHISKICSEHGKEGDLYTATMETYSRVWLLAHYLQIEPLMNYAMHRLITLVDENASHIPDLETVEDWYRDTPVDSILRKFLVHLLVWEHKGAIELSRDVDADMPRKLVREMQRRCDGEASPFMNVRNYYVGEDAVTPTIEVEVADEWADLSPF